MGSCTCWKRKASLVLSRNCASAAVRFTGSMASSFHVRLGKLKSPITRMCDALWSWALRSSWLSLLLLFSSLFGLLYMQPSRSLFFPSRLMSSQMHSSYFVMSFKLLRLGFRDRCMYMHTPMPRSSRFSNSSYPSMCSSQRSMAYLVFFGFTSVIAITCGFSLVTCAFSSGRLSIIESAFVYNTVKCDLTVSLRGQTGCGAWGAWGACCACCARGDCCVCCVCGVCAFSLVALIVCCLTCLPNPKRFSFDDPAAPNDHVFLAFLPSFLHLLDQCSVVRSLLL